MNKNDSKMTKAKIFSLVIGTALCAGSVPAYASFEWTPPPARSAVPEMPATPAPAVQSHRLTGMPGEKDMYSPEAAVPRAPFMKAPASQEAPVTAHHAPVAKEEVKQYDKISGFGSDIPLILALRQIVPAHYGYHFDEGISQGQRVSWDGGRPWNEVLQETLGAVDLHAVIGEGRLWIREGGKEPSAAPAPVEKASSLPTPAPMGMRDKISYDRADFLSASGVTGYESVPMPVEDVGTRVDYQEAATRVAPFQSYPRRAVTASFKADVTPPPSFSGALPVSDEDSSRAAITAPEPLTRAAAPETPPRQPSRLEGRADISLSGHDRHNPVMDPLEIFFWQADKGESLRDVLSRWSSQANVTLIWETTHDFRLKDAINMHGTFGDVTGKLLSSYQGDLPRPIGQLHPNLPTGPSVLVVQNYGHATTN